MHAFWQSGYETTSISDLTTAMGVTTPSLYSAFGDKKGLFLEALRLYAGDRNDLREAFAKASSAKIAVRDMMVGAAMRFTDVSTPKGCLLASAAASGSKGASDIRDAIAAEREAVRLIIVDRIEADVRCGDLPSNTDPNVLANVAIATIQGMSVLARDGLERPAIIAVADASIECWPVVVSI
jgi:AcrR family transcriptional regulator